MASRQEVPAGTAELTPEELARISARFEGRPPQEALRWAVERFAPDIALACSFGVEDVALVDMLAEVDGSVRVFYLDTGLLFPETYDVRDRVVERYGARLVRAVPAISVEDQASLYGDELWARNANLCCDIRKVQPLTTVLGSLRAWITGIRRDQALTRANTPIVGWDQKFGLVKVNPLAAWTSADVWKYVAERDVPYNVLHDQGYPSIGCVPCTRQVTPGEDPRAGRWSGSDKTECGLHQ